jgi:hypothetical protein
MLPVEPFVLLSWGVLFFPPFPSFSPLFLLDVHTLSLPMNEDYKRYLESSDWLNLRAEMIARAKGCCEPCLSGGPTLHAHHLTYANIFHEPKEDLIVLCKECHEKIETAIRSAVISRKGDVALIREATLQLLTPETPRKFKRPMAERSPFEDETVMEALGWSDPTLASAFVRAYYREFRGAENLFRACKTKYRQLHPREGGPPPFSAGPVIMEPLTEDHIRQATSKLGGLSRRQLACIGVPWPPVHDWKRLAIGRLIRPDMLKSFLSGR